MKKCTGSQLTLIIALRKELGLRVLSSHEITCLTISSASVMIADLKAFKDTLSSLSA